MTNDILILLPLLIPMFSALLAFAAWRYRNAQRGIQIASSAIMVSVSLFIFATVEQEGILTTQAGNWAAPFGITLVIDMFSAIMLIISSIIWFVSALYAAGSIDKSREAYGFHPLLILLIMGINGSFTTGDIFNLYVWFEVMLLSSFALIALGGERAQLEGATKYVSINLFSSFLFLIGIGFLYGTFGTLNLADLSVKVRAYDDTSLVTLVSLFFMVSFGIKSAVFPLFFWLPASYHTPPVVISALFAGMLTKVGVYALIRVFTLVFVHDVAFTHTILLIAAGFTMVTGVLGAAAQQEIRRILSFHIISQIGYMLMGLALFSPLAIAGAVFYIIHHIIVKTNLFFIGGIVQYKKGSAELPKIGGLYKAYPFLGFLFLIPAFSLAGIPPLSGFWSKYLLAKAGFAIDEYVIIAVSLAVGLLTLYSMTKIWNQAFLKPQPAEYDTTIKEQEFAVLPFSRKAALYAPAVLLACITIGIGLFPETFFTIAEKAAGELLDPSAYVEAVLGGGK